MLIVIGEHRCQSCGPDGVLGDQRSTGSATHHLGDLGAVDHPTGGELECGVGQPDIGGSPDSRIGGLTNNSADVMITDASEIRWEANQDPQLCGVSLDHPFTFEQKGYLIPQSASDVQEWINEWLNIAQNDGTYAALSNKYLGVVIGP